MSSDFSARTRQYQDALYEALAGGQQAVRDADPVAQLAALVSAGRGLTTDETSLGALDALDGVASRDNLDEALSEAAALFESPQRFREALYFARCLEHDAASADELMQARRYLSGAAVPAAEFPELATDQAALLDATSFETLWREPDRLRWMIDTVAIWRRAYLPVYLRDHSTYSAGIAAVIQQIEDLQWQVAAVHKLNELQRLGPTVAGPELVQLQQLEDLIACHAETAQLTEALETEPACPGCGYRLGDQAPTADARRIAQAIERGLATQQTRLAQRVVSRLLARPGRSHEDRLDRFIQVVQAADLSGLAQVLDEGLLEFISDLLETPEPRVNLIDQLAHDYPEVTPENLAIVVDAFRRLVESEVERHGGRIVIGREEDA